jgi:kumamolisin
VAFENRVALAGSERALASDAREVAPVDPSERLRVTVILGRQSGQAGGGASPEAIQRFGEFASYADLKMVEGSAPKRRVVLEGTAAALMQAFGTTVAHYEMRTAGKPCKYRCRRGGLTIPSELAGDVIAVLGLDNRPVAKPHIRFPNAAPATSFTPPQVAALYNFPKNLTGEGQTVAIIELGGGFVASDLKTYFSELKVSEPSVTAVSVDGGKNAPGSDADGEVMLDIEVVGSIAPGANIAVYFAPNTDQGFVDAITEAVHDSTRKPSVISISWGGPEDSWTEQARNAMNAALQDAANLGVTVTAAAGDGGSSDGAGDGKLHVDFPASSPFALACGGTKLVGSGSKISSEVVWNETVAQEGATGGGVSTVFALPDYQTNSKVPQQPETKFAGRGVPDVSGNADPSTGYKVRVTEQDQVIGGTSAVAPLWAALVALLNQSLGKPVGYLQPQIYTLGEAFRDITSGNNDDSNLGYYKAGSGWDACTGLGSPNGAALLEALSSSSSS